MTEFIDYTYVGQGGSGIFIIHDAAIYNSNIPAPAGSDIYVKAAYGYLLDYYYPYSGNNPNPAAYIDNRPTLVWFHGGGFLSGAPYHKGESDADWICKEFAMRGYKAVSVDYRLYRQQSGTSGAYVAAAQDARAALGFLKRFGSFIGINPNKLIIGGHSAGATTALLGSIGNFEGSNGQSGYTGAITRAACTFLIAPVTTLYGLDCTLDPTLKGNIMSGQLNGAYIMHGDQDSDSPIANGLNIYNSWLTNAAVPTTLLGQRQSGEYLQFQVLTGAGHAPWWRNIDPRYPNSQGVLEDGFPPLFRHLFNKLKLTSPHRP